MLLKNRSNFLAFLLLLFTTGLILWILFGNVISNPGNFLFGEGDDAIKNYYTFIYYTLFDSGTHFSGMNYPYGDHVVFTDSQPIFSLLTNQLHKLIGFSSLQIIGLVNLLMIAGFLAGAVFLYLILRKNQVPAWFAIIAANLITFLNPQLMRIRNHYALSYMFVVPVTWYILIKIFENRKSFRWFLIYVVFSYLTGFIHPYHLTISAILTLAYTAVFAFQEFSKLKANGWFLLKLAGMAVLPLVLFQATMALTDPIPDRPKTPWGFLVYRTNFESVFFPTEEPFLGFWRELFKTDEPIWEGYAYVGMLGLVILALTFVLALRHLRKGRISLIFRPVLPLPLRIGIWAGILTLLFAMGIPFIFGLESLLEYLPPLKQFRSIGRFAWIFYYIFSVYMAFYFYRLYRYLSIKNARSFGLGLLAIVFLIWGLDAKINAGRKIRDINRQDSALSFAGNSGNYTETLARAGRNATEFQAILPLPYFLVGSEYFGFYRSSASAYEAMKASLNLGLPVATGMMSRTSYSQSMQLTQLLSHDLIQKEVLARYPNRKPLLLITTNETLTPEEQNLVAKATLIAQSGRMTYYELPVQRMQADLPGKVQAFEARKAGLKPTDGVFTEGPNEAIVIKNFGNHPSGAYLFDAGAAFVPKGNLPLYNAVIPKAQDSTTYEVSVWWQLNPELPLSILKLKRYDNQGNLLEEVSQPSREPTDIYKNWAKATLEIKLQHATDRLEVLLEADGSRADNLLIRPKGTDVYYYTNNGRNLIMNNYQLK